jgi:polyphosphate kinase
MAILPRVSANVDADAVVPQRVERSRGRDRRRAATGDWRTRVSPRPSHPDRGLAYLNRELSWLDFNTRVLALAEDASLPLLERARFLAIFSRNLDEFFQVRVAGLKEQLAAGVVPHSAEGGTPREQLAEIRARVLALVQRHARCFCDDVAVGLERSGISFVRWSSLDERDRAQLSNVFDRTIFPVLTPLAVDPAHPFPYISNLSLNLAVAVADPQSHETHVARVKVPSLLQRFVPLPDGVRFVPLEQVIAAHLPSLFPGMEIVAHHTFRLTRNADFELESDEAEDLLDAVQSVLQRRRRSPLAVRLEIDAGMSDDVLDLLVRELELDQGDVYRIDAPLDLGGLWDIAGIDRPDLKSASWTPVTPPQLQTAGDRPGDIFAVLREGPVLVHHPYESFETSVVRFIDQAAADPRVLAIKQTLYRTSGPFSPIIGSLTQAAESGKQVVALIELTARFDEQNNIAWAQLLEDAGVHVVYGMVGLKTHCKVALVVRQDEDGRIRRYVHVGTGNYNSDTARAYEDVGLLTCDEGLGADVSELFNVLTGYSRQRDYRQLLVAPVTLRSGLLELIRGQAREGGRITIKANSLVDPETIDALYEASQAGAEIDLVVRGICCLRPGVPGLSERIRVRSIVGRYLEHSRIWRFGSGANATHYIGSADLMPRNLDRRVETAVPVRPRALRARLDEILQVELEDDALAWELHSDGSWSRVPAGVGCNTHTRLQELARVRALDVP